MSTINYGQPAPQWLRDLEIYNLLNRKHEAWAEENGIRFPLLTHVPVDRAFLEKWHDRGTRLMPYVNFMEKRGLAATHPEWVLIGPDGEFELSGWAKSHHIPDQHHTCLNSQGIHEWALAEVRRIMDLGYDGVFVDNVAYVSECHGERLGKHTHAWKARTNTECYYDLVGRIYQLVKSYGPDKAVMINSVINDDLWSVCDSQMDENIVFSGDRPERSCQWNRVLVRYAKAHYEAARHGKVPVWLSYFDLPRRSTEMLEGAFFSYVLARLFDLLWADWFTLVENGYLHDAARTLYQLRLGPAREEYVERNFVLYRRFQDGAVALNADEWNTREIVIPVEQDGVWVNLAARAAHHPQPELTARGGRLVVHLAHGAGSIYVPAPAR